MSMKFSKKQQRQLIGGLVALAVLILGWLGYGSLSGSSDVPEGAFVVERVIDGDTIVVRESGLLADTYTIRLIGVNTPETVDPRKTVECFGQEASNFLKTALPEGTAIYLDADAEKPNEDQYGRLLRYVVRADNNVLINRDIIEKGYGHEADFGEPYFYKEDFVHAQRVASEAKLGLWADNACLK